jgi:hypothetical protein
MKSKRIPVSKKVLLAAAMFAWLGADTGFAETRFRGNILFTAVQNCPDGYAREGWHFRSEFHPRVAGNDNFSAVSLVFDYGAAGFKLDNANFTASYQEVLTGGVGWGDAYVPPQKAFVLVSAQQPATLSPTSPSVIVTGKIKNVWGQDEGVNCEVSFRGVYARKLN